MGKKARFKGVPVRALYDIKDNDYKVYVVQTKSKDVVLNKYGSVTVLGIMQSLELGCEYMFNCEEEPSPKNVGELQYKVTEGVERDLPKSNFEKRNFLNQFLTMGQSETLLNAYPDIVDMVISDDGKDVDLSKTKGIKEATWNKIKNRIKENFVYMGIISDFGNILTINMVKKLFEKYNTTELIRQHMSKKPYKMMCSLSGVGFLTADKKILDIQDDIKEKLASGKEVNFKFEEEDMRYSLDRAYSATEYILLENENKGSTKMKWTSFKTQLLKYVPEAFDYIKTILKDEEFIVLDRETNAIGLKSTYDYEIYIAKTLQNAIKIEFEKKIVDAEKYRDSDGIPRTDEQISTIEKLVNNKVSLLIGFAGSGKSSSLNAILNYLDDERQGYLLFAPTGRASKQMNIYTDRPSFTIHRGLGFQLGGGFAYNETNKLPYNYIILDESSMVDIRLMKSLISAIDFNKTHLLMIGDPEQLPSVACGNVFHDIIVSKVFVTTMLDKIFRYGEGGVLTVATDIRNGKKFLNESGGIQKFGSNEDFIFIPSDAEKTIVNSIKIYKKLLDNGVPKEEVMILSSQNVGGQGTIVFNKHLQQMHNKNKEQYVLNKENDVNVTVGDLVLQTKNDYNAKIFIDKNVVGSEDDDDENVAFIANGDIGFVVDIFEARNGNKYIVVNFDGIVVFYSLQQAGYCMTLAYSMSIHKSQGGSARYVILVTPSTHTFMLNSNLLYVGVTRTKVKCYMIGDATIVNKAVNKKENLSRDTWLENLLNSDLSFYLLPSEKIKVKELEESEMESWDNYEF